MSRSTFTHPQVIQIMGESFNSCFIDTRADSSVVHFDSTIACGSVGITYNLLGTPHIIVLYSDGTYLGAIKGYQDAESLALQLHAIRSNYSN